MSIASRRLAVGALSVAGTMVAVAVAGPVWADPPPQLIVSTSQYAGDATTLHVGDALPISTGVTAIANGTYPNVFANDTVDGNFGITSPLTLTSFATSLSSGTLAVGGSTGTLNVTAATGITTSFSSKSEGSLNVSTDGKSLTIMGYNAPVNMLDVSNSNTPTVSDPTNTDTQTPTSRSIVQVNSNGTVQATNTNTYSGNNGRAAVLATNVNGTGVNEYLAVGNAGNGSGTEPNALVKDTGVQLVTPGTGNNAVVGVQQGTVGAANGNQYGFSVTQVPPNTADKSGKDDNFRGETVFNNTLYVTKGSGSNGINTVYQVSVPGGGLPTAATASEATFSILPGLNTGLAKASNANSPSPFGIWFANATTLYVADEGDGGSSDVGGLQKWTFNGTTWVEDYNLTNGLNLGEAYAVAGYPTADDPANAGLRDLTGYYDPATGDVTLFASTSTTSSIGDQGADPNSIVEITDSLSATSLPGGEMFTTVDGPTYGTVYRGVALTDFAVPEPASLAVLASGLAGLGVLRRRRRA